MIYIRFLGMAVITMMMALIFFVLTNNIYDLSSEENMTGVSGTMNDLFNIFPVVLIISAVLMIAGFLYNMVMIGDGGYDRPTNNDSVDREIAEIERKIKEMESKIKEEDSFEKPDKRKKFDEWD